MNRLDERVLALFDRTSRDADQVIRQPESLRNNEELLSNEICFYKIDRLMFDEDYPHREAFENVLRSLDSEAFNFVYMLTGDENGIELCLGVVKNHNENSARLGRKLSAVNYGEIIAESFRGNFGGSQLQKLTGQRLKEAIFTSAEKYKNAGVIVGIPSVDESDDSKYGFQGIDRLINSMLGLRWRLVIVCEPIAAEQIEAMQSRAYSLYDQLNRYAKKSVQESQNVSINESDSTTRTEGSNKNWSKSFSESNSSGTHDEDSNSGHSTQRGDSRGGGSNESTAVGKTNGMSFGQSQSTSTEVINKRVQEILKYLDEELLERLRAGRVKGMFNTSICYMAEKPVDAGRLRAGLMSLFQGNNSSYSPLQSYPLDVDRIGANILRLYQNCYTRELVGSEENLTLLSRPRRDNRTGLSTYLTPREISLIAGLPQHEVPGIVVSEGVDFGLNFSGDGEIVLGNLVRRGCRLENMPVKLKRDMLNKHIFIAGVTGSGKTTTCHKLLTEVSAPFLVIEPAKTEYRALLNHFNDVTVFTAGDESLAPLRLNPFELVEGELLSSHIDMLKAAFTSAFEMEASMPQLLEEAIYLCYEKKGWDADSNKNYAAKDREDIFPVLGDFLIALEEIVETKGFSGRLRDDYRGSLVSRFSNLTKGAKGAMLNCRRSIDFGRLVERNVVIEMESLKSAEDKALLMGFILQRLSVVLKNKHRKDKHFRHLTLVEEAHRLLSKPELGESGARKSAVETFTDLLAEIRKYGEGMIIIDQIPNKLAPEVLKNTNTKIIHKLFARDDKEAVGDTMMMNDQQKNYLSALEIGQAIVFSEGMNKPISVQIERVTDTNDDDVSDEFIRRRYAKHFGKFRADSEIIRRLYRPFDELLKKIAAEYVKDFNIGNGTREAAENFSRRVSDFRAEFGETVDLSEEYLYNHLTDEKTKRARRDDKFRDRLRAFVGNFFERQADISVEKAFDRRETFRLLDDLRLTY